jgi:hypothetical protein
LGLVIGLTTPHLKKISLLRNEKKKPRRRWVNNIKMDFREIEWDGMSWIDLAEDRDNWRALVYTVVNLRVP